MNYNQKFNENKPKILKRTDSLNIEPEEKIQPKGNREELKSGEKEMIQRQV